MKVCKIIKPKKNKSLCGGCTDNFYNGNNEHGVKKCLHYKSATVKKVLCVGINECPPYDEKEICYCLSCYKRRGVAFIRNFGEIKKGDYKGCYCSISGISYFENKKMGEPEGEE